MKPLRDYQEQCASHVFREWETVTSTLAVCPTGTGKTRIAAEIVKRVLPKRTMFVAHRKELIFQARNAIDEIIRTGDLFNDLYCEIEMAELYAHHQRLNNSPVIAMVQSLNSKNGSGRRMDRFHPDQFGLLVIDEFHHSVSESYQSVINYFKRNPNLKILGLTATPDRMDEEALGQVCDSVAFDYEILDAINDGWLVPVDQVMVPIKGLDFSHVKTVAGDLNQSDLAAIMEAESVIQGVVQPVLELMFNLKPHELAVRDPCTWGEYLSALDQKPRRTLVFTVSVAQSEMLSNVFNRVMTGMSDWVCGKTPENERADKLSRFSAGEIPVMVNCNCLSEGFDSPGVEIIVQARPTKSRSLYAQQVGRATRPLAGVTDGVETAELRRQAIAQSAKPCCLVVDFVGNSGKHKLMTSADILGGNVSDSVLDRARKRLEQLGKPARVSDVIAEAEEDERAELEKRRRVEEARKNRIVAKTNYTIRKVNPFDVLDIIPTKSRGWDKGKTLSDKQRNLLLKQGINPDSIPYSQARQIIGELFNRWHNKQASFKQAGLLKRYHLPATVSREQASKWLDAIAKNGWRKPANLEVPNTDTVPF